MRGRLVATDGSAASGEGTRSVGEGTVFAVLLSLSFAHLLNDLIQSLLPAIYPVLKSSFQLSFTQVGLITLTFHPPPAGDRALHGPSPDALLARPRDGLHARRAAAVDRGHLRGGPP